MIENLPTKVDDVGRIVIPKKARKMLNIEYNEELLLTVKKNTIELKKQSKNNELSKIKEKVKKIEQEFNISFLIANDNEIVYTSKKYENLKDRKTINDKISNITYSKLTKITNEDTLEEPHYYCSLTFDNYTKGQIFVIFNDENDDKLAKLFINLLIR